MGDYFAGGLKPLKVKVDDQAMRSTPGFGEVKTGGNYAAAMRQVVQAQRELGADQVLFAPGGDIQETGAANFILIEGDELLTTPLDGSILPGVTRDSILTLARDAGLATDAYRLAMAAFLVDEPGAALEFQWIPGLRRPAPAVRFGVGVDYSGSNAASVKKQLAKDAQVKDGARRAASVVDYRTSEVR